jgi:hypothetical protein
VLVKVGAQVVEPAFIGPRPIGRDLEAAVPPGANLAQPSLEPPRRILERQDQRLAVPLASDFPQGERVRRNGVRPVEKQP